MIFNTVCSIVMSSEPMNEVAVQYLDQACYENTFSFWPNRNSAFQDCVQKTHVL